MAQKTVEIDGIGTVILQRRKGTKHIRLSIRPDGTLRVGMPPWVTYRAAMVFLNSQRDWLDKHRKTRPAPTILLPDMIIGKSHRLVFRDSEKTSRTTVRVVDDEVRVTHPVGMLYVDASVQKAAERGTIKALTAQSTELLLPRLAELATQHGFDYRSASVKRLRTRWGSCSNHKDITLNCHLVQLPWDLIDYVLLHELLHTQIMRHGEPFWSALAGFVSNLPDKRKAMRLYSPGFAVPIDA